MSTSMLAAAGGAESSVGSVYCVVYRLVALEWQVTGAGWSQVQVFRDSGDGSHRLVGWTVEDGLLTINSNISADCHYKRKSDDFHKLTDEEGQQWGFGFYKKAESKREAVKFMQLVQHLIRHPIHVCSPPSPTPTQALHLPPPVPSRTSSADTAVPPLSLASPLDGRTSSSNAAHPPPIPVSSRPSSQRPSVHIHYDPSVSSSSTTFRMADTQQSPSASQTSQSASLPVTSTRSRSTSSTSPKSVTRPMPSPPTHPIPSRHGSISSTAPSTSAAAASAAAASAYNSINHTNTFVTTGQALSGTSNYSPKAFRSSPPPVITLGMLKPTGFSAVASQSPSSAPPSYPVTSSQSPPSQPMRLATQDSASSTKKGSSDKPPFASSASMPAAASFASASPHSHPRSSSTKSASRLQQPSSSTQNTPSASPVDLPTPPSTSPPIVPMRPVTQTLDRKDSLTLHSPVLHRKDSDLLDELSNQPIPPLGTLKILPAKLSKAQPSSQSSPTHSMVASSTSSIADPHTVVHTVHVKYDPATRQYSGLPAHMVSALQQQFGLPPTSVDRMQLPGYACRIPVVLVELQRGLRQSDGGLRAEGVFRVAPDAEECSRVKRSMDKGERLTSRDVYVIANLIKIWFRDLPGKKVLDEVDATAMGAASDVEAVGRVVAGMSELYGSLLAWLLDVCCEVVRCGEWNKMTSKALGIVFAPNLFSPVGDDPVGSMLQVQKVALFVQRAIDWRMEQPPPPQ